jgi:hypothetical protein
LELSENTLEELASCKLLFGQKVDGESRCISSLIKLIVTPYFLDYSVPLSTLRGGDSYIRRFSALVLHADTVFLLNSAGKSSPFRLYGLPQGSSVPLSASANTIEKFGAAEDVDQ